MNAEDDQEHTIGLDEIPTRLDDEPEHLLLQTHYVKKTGKITRKESRMLAAKTKRIMGWLKPVTENESIINNAVRRERSSIT